MAIPGGSAAETLLPALVEAPIDWDRVSVFWVDERMVPPDDPDSNFRLAKEVWLDRIPVAPASVHRMTGDADGLRASSSPRDWTWRSSGSAPTATSPPSSRDIGCSRTWDRDVAVLDDAPKPPARRMTLTLRAIAASRRVVVFAAGPAKSAAIADALKNEDSELPVALVTLGDAPVSFLLDPAAAAGL